MAAKVKKRLARKTSSAASRGRCSGITRRLDAQFAHRASCTKTYRRAAIALGIQVDNELVLYAKDPATPLCTQAKVFIYI